MQKTFYLIARLQLSRLSLLRFGAILVCATSLSLTPYAQQKASNQAEQIEPQVTTLRQKLEATSLTDEDREKLLFELASLEDTLGESKFSTANYDEAANLFTTAGQHQQQMRQLRLAKYQKQLDEAEQKLSDAERIQEKERRDVVVSAMRIYVQVLLDQVKYEAQFLNDNATVLRCLNRLIELARQTKDSAKEADVLEALGDLEAEHYRKQSALDFYERALLIRRVLGKNVFRSLGKMASLHAQFGILERALSLYQESIQALQNESDSNADPNKKNISPILAEANELARNYHLASRGESLLSICRIRAAQGEYAVALKSFEEITPIIGQIYEAAKKAGKDSESLIRILGQSQEAGMLSLRARINEATGDEAKAIQDYTKALTLFSANAAAMGKQSVAVAMLRSRIALLLSARGQHEMARAHTREALQSFARLRDENGLISALVTSSKVEREAGNADEGLRLAKQAVAAAERLGVNHLLADAYEARGAVLVLLNQANDAIPAYLRAVEIDRTVNIRPSLARTLGGLGLAYQQAGKPKEAEAAYAEAIAIIESIRSGIESEDTQTRYLNRRDIASLYERMVALLIKQGKASEAMSYASRSNQRELLGAVRPAAIRSSALKVATEATSREKAITSAIETERRKTTQRSGSIAQLETELRVARREYAEAVKQIEKERPDLHFTVRPINLLKLQASLAQNEAVIEYLAAEDRLFIFTVTRTNIAVRQAPIRRDALMALVEKTRTLIRSFGEDVNDPTRHDDAIKPRQDFWQADKSEIYRDKIAPLREKLTTLHTHLISPVEDLLKNVKTIAVIPSGKLFYLPFTALVSPANNKFLIETHNIICLTEGDLLDAPTTNSNQVIAFGNPTGADLEGTLDEVRAIRASFPSARIYEDAQASKQQLFKIRSARVLHLATHGLLNPQDPMASQIFLAQLQGVGEPNVSVGEIYELPLKDSEMIVLSACETALGEENPGTEVGVFVEAFRHATRTVAASLWSVDDQATLKIMTGLYQGLAAKRSAAEALRQGQLSVLQNPKMKHPYFWSAFVLYGDWRRASSSLAKLGAKPRGKK